MQIKQISVTGLFGFFDHVIPLNMNDRITIVHSPNGFGKTAMLKLTNGLFNSQYSAFRTIPFRCFQITFADNTIINVRKNSNNESSNKAKRENIVKRESITMSLSESNIEGESFDLDKIVDSTEIGFPMEILESIPDLYPINSSFWRYSPTNEMLSLHEVLDRFKDILPPGIKKRGESEILDKLKYDIHVRLIESQRLLNVIPNRSSRIYPGSTSMLPTVSAYSDELAQIMRDKFSEYGEVSQSLDRTFPNRLVKRQSSPNLTDEQLRDRLEQLEVTRSRLISIGLLEKTENVDFPIQPPAMDESTKNILSVYVEDVEKKLSVFNDVASKIDLLRRIINSKFAYSYKEMSFNKDKGFVFKTLYNSSVSDSDTLLPTDLSSGEQHELVLLYELLFKVEPKSLVLIDEPELSLHVGWQVQFLKDLQEIVKLADLDILMATHSPDIIQDRWDLTVELQGMKK
jgi:predicted ATP-binding protein involved in virulence